jgi:hypothetical protein
MARFAFNPHVAVGDGDLRRDGGPLVGLRGGECSDSVASETENPFDS